MNRFESTLCCFRRLPTSPASRMSWRTYWSMSSGTQTTASAQHSTTWAPNSTAVPVLHIWRVCYCGDAAWAQHIFCGTFVAVQLWPHHATDSCDGCTSPEDSMHAMHAGFDSGVTLHGQLSKLLPHHIKEFGLRSHLADISPLSSCLWPLAGKRYRDVRRSFPRATVIGWLSGADGSLHLNSRDTTIVQPGSQLIFVARGVDVTMAALPEPYQVRSAKHGHNYSTSFCGCSELWLTLCGWGRELGQPTHMCSTGCGCHDGCSARTLSGALNKAPP